MAKLTEVQKRFIVQRYAYFDTPTEIIAAVEERFGLTLRMPQVSQYNPETASGARDLSAKLKEHFEEQRALAKADEDAIGISHRAVRLAALDKILRGAMARKNYVLAMRAMEQAAKERGDVFTNTSKVELPEGIPAFVVRREAAAPPPAAEGAA